MTWCIKHWTEFSSLAPEWARIAKSAYSDHPFLDVNVVTSALEYFANDDVGLLENRVSDTVRSIGILSRKRWGVWETFAPSQIPFTLFVTDEPEPTLSVTRSVIRALPGTVLLLGLNHFDEEYMGRMHSSKLLEKIEYGQTMNVAVTGEFDEYWGARSKNLKKNIRRYERRLHSKFDCFMDVKSHKSDVPDAIKIYGDIESSGWKGKRGSAVHIDNRQGEFYCSVMKGAADFDGARVFHLFADNRPIASRLAILKNGIMVILKTTYDEAFSEYAPGRLLLKYVLKYAFEEDSVKNVEFYTKATQDQLRWATSSRPIYHCNLYSTSALKFAAKKVRTLRLSRRASESE